MGWWPCGSGGGRWQELATRSSDANVSQRFHALRFGPCTRPLAARRSRITSSEYARHDIHAAASFRLTKYAAPRSIGLGLRCAFAASELKPLRSFEPLIVSSAPRIFRLFKPSAAA